MNTKIKIETALKLLLKTKKFEKITIRDICDCASISRPTFYKYYKDKFDLVNSIFDELFDSTVEYLSISLPWNEQIYKFLSGLQKNKSFYKKIYSYNGQNSLYEHQSKRVYQLYKSIIESKKGGQISFDEDICLKIYIKGSMTLITDWANDDFKKTVDNVMMEFRISLPENIRDYFI